MRRWIGALALSGLATVGLVSFPAVVPAPAMIVQARAFHGTPAVGALFSSSRNVGLGAHFCTASVVQSPHGDLVLTAAHCLAGKAPGHLFFVPGYRDDRAPYGVWGVTRIVVDRNWAASADPDDDFAFLVVARPGGGRIEDGTGGERLGINQPSGQLVRVAGYPDGANLPIRCDRVIRLFSPSQLVFDCGGYTDGTSGSPLLTDVNTSTGLGTVIGVIGGYEQGGYSPAVSYAAKFASDIAALYTLAVSRS